MKKYTLILLLCVLTSGLFFYFHNSAEASLAIAQHLDDGIDSLAYHTQYFYAPPQDNANLISHINVKLKYNGGCAPGEKIYAWIRVNGGPYDSDLVEVTNFTDYAVVSFPLNLHTLPVKNISSIDFYQWDTANHCPVNAITLRAAQRPDYLWYYFNSGSPQHVLWFEVHDVTTEPPPPEPTHTPVLIVPGIMGTEINKESEIIWPDVSRMVFTRDDRFMDPLAYTDQITPLDTSLSVGRVLNKAGTLNYTEGLVLDLEDQNYVNNQSLFLFPYDWRKDVTEVAHSELAGRIDAILSETLSDKLDIVAHSQGGLVVKKLLHDNPAYQSKINKLIFVGTPHLGAPKAAKALLYGDDMGVNVLGLGLDPEEIKRIGKNMPAVYNLLPSREYFNHAGGYLGTTVQVAPGVDVLDILDFDESKEKLKSSSLNSTLVDRADSFHESSFDNFSFSGTGIEAFNIVGCQEATITQVLQRKGGKYKLTYGPGDVTVPVQSANNLSGVTTYYALDTNHGTMMTSNGIRQLLVNTLSGSSLPVDNNVVTQNASRCIFNGKKVSVHSPVSLHIYDSQGNHTGPLPDGTIEYGIPGVQYDILDHQKFTFLPEGENYTVKLIGEDTGTFDFYETDVVNANETNTTFFNDVPVTNTTTASVVLDTDITLEMDTNSDGTVDTTVNPSSVLDANQAEDVVVPATIAELGGQGNSLFYRSNVTVTLNAQDDNAGVLATYIAVDSGAFEVYQNSKVILSESQHQVRFYSIDKAGNEEDIETITFTIDKTAPEAKLQWSQALKDIVVTGTDNYDSSPTVVDSGSVVTIIDDAGNVTKLYFSQSNRIKSLRAELSGLEYNGTKVDVSKNKLVFYWVFDKTGKLKALSQIAYTKNGFSILAYYDGKNTVITGLDKTGRMYKKFVGLRLLTVNTNNGVLEWAY